MIQYRHTVQDAAQFTKYGIDLTVYGQRDPAATVVHVNVERGHFQEFYNVESSYTYYIVRGRGTFYLNGAAVAVGATDLVAVPPGTRIYYFGTMEMVLTVAPAFAEEDERHVRFIDEGEIGDGEHGEGGAGDLPAPPEPPGPVTCQVIGRPG